MNCLRYLDLTDYDQVLRMSIEEYSVRMKAYNLKKNDELWWEHRKIWLSERVVSAVNSKDNKFYIKGFDDFYQSPKDKENQARSFNRLHAIRRNLEKYRGKEGKN